MSLFSSLGLSGVAHGVDGGVLLGNLVVDLLVVEAGKGRTDVVFLSHLEVLSEVLVSAPPVEVDHAESLVSEALMEVGVTNVVLLAIGRESAVTVAHGVGVAGLTHSPSPVLQHILLLILHEHVHHEGLVEVVDKQSPDQSESVLSVQGADLPVNVSSGVLEEPGNVLESSPSLGFITRLVGLVHEFGEVTVSLLGKGSKNN